jgi:hypothetical protein
MSELRVSSLYNIITEGEVTEKHMWEKYEFLIILHRACKYGGSMTTTLNKILLYK